MWSKCEQIKKGGLFMEFIITESAEEQLKKLNIAPLCLRIDIQPVGTCSAVVDIDLTLDERQHDDVIFEKNGLTILANSFARDYLGSKVKLDHVAAFRLTTPNETLAYGLSVKRK